MITATSTYLPQIATLCQYCGTDYSRDDCPQTADPATFVEYARTFLRTLDAWGLLPPSRVTALQFARSIASLAVSIISSSKAVAEVLEKAFFIPCMKAIRELTSIRKKIVNYNPQKLMPLDIANTTEEQLQIMRVWMEMPRLLKQIADNLAMVGKAATMPCNTCQPSICHWLPRFKSHIEDAIAARAKEMDEFIARAMYGCSWSRRRALVEHRNQAAKMLRSTKIGELYLEKWADSPCEFVTELRRLSIKGGKAMNASALDNLVGNIVDYEWACRALAKMTTIINVNQVDIHNEYKTENEMNVINPKGCQFNEGNGTVVMGDNLAREFMGKKDTYNNVDTNEIIKTSLEAVVKMKAPDGGAMITSGTQLEAVRCATNEVLGVRLSKKVFATTIEQMHIEGLPEVNIYTAIASVDEKFATTPIDEWINNSKLTVQKSFSKQHAVAIAFKKELEKNATNS